MWLISGLYISFWLSFTLHPINSTLSGCPLLGGGRGVSCRIWCSLDTQKFNKYVLRDDETRHDTSQKKVKHCSKGRKVENRASNGEQML